jgi:predicted lipoprotein
MVDIEARERDIRMTIGPIYDGMIIRDTGTRIVVD